MAKKQKSKKSGSSRKAPKTPAAALPPKAPRTRERDPRLPAPGTVIVRPYKGREIRVKVLEDTFECEGAEFRSLSALAARITEADSINGFLFFKLTEPKGATPKERSTPTAAEPAKKTKTRKPRAAAQRDPPAKKCESESGCTNDAEFGVPIGGGSTLLCGACVDKAEDVTRADCIPLNE